MYDNQIGRFFTQDRFADLYHSFNPYQYTANNPINYVDENGDYITINGSDEKNNPISVLYENGKLYNYTSSTDKKGNVTITKGDVWGGKNDFITQAGKDLDAIAGTKEGNTIVSDLQGSQYGYNLHNDNSKNFAGTGFEGKDEAKGGGNIYYSQKGGSHANASINKSAVVLGHELLHGWAFEFTNENRSSSTPNRLTRETAAVKFENYLRASFGETIMRTNYLLRGSNYTVASSSVSEAKNYKLPHANYLVPMSMPRTISPQSDNTVNRTPIRIPWVDTRTKKL
jgi:Effector protein